MKFLLNFVLKDAFIREMFPKRWSISSLGCTRSSKVCLENKSHSRIGLGNMAVILEIFSVTYPHLTTLAMYGLSIKISH